RSKIRQVQTLALLGLQNDFDRLADISLSLGPVDAAIGSHSRWKGEASSVERASVHGYDSFAENFGSGKQIWKNGIQKNTMSSSLIKISSRISAQMVMMGME